MELTSFAFETNFNIKYKNPFFKYNDRIFRVWSNPQTSSISFDTITRQPSDTGYAFSDIVRFLLLLSWTHEVSFQFMASGSMSCPDVNFFMSRKVPLIEVPSRSPFFIVRFDTICGEPGYPEVVRALSLYNDACFSGNPFFRFLRFFQILETKRDVNKNIWLEETKERIFGQKEVAKFEREHGSLPQYFIEECRNAIVHITRYSGRTEIEITSFDDYYSIVKVVPFAERIGIYFIENELQFPKHPVLRWINSVNPLELLSMQT